MRILELQALTKEESFIYYINRYKATAVVEVLMQTLKFPVSFSIEINPLGQKTIDLDPLPKNLDYPVVPLSKTLKAYINQLYDENKLPQT